MIQEEKINIGIVGTGYISRHFYIAFNHRSDLTISRVLTRRDVNTCSDYPNVDVLTNSINELIDNCDLIYECSGDPIYATDIIAKAIASGKLVVTTNAEFHVTSGSYFVKKCMVTEANGDQPGSLATLNKSAIEMGFKPLAYVNMKGFFNATPTIEDMRYWAKKQGISVPNVTSFTDGTKIQIEQALVANGCGATFAKPGMLGLENKDIDAVGKIFGDLAKEVCKPISDYIIFPGAPHGVFIVAEHDEAQRAMLKYVKMGEGPYYILKQDAILLHLEVLHTIRNFFETRRVLLDNSIAPEINVVPVSKRKLSKNTFIKRGIGGFDVRGIGVKIVDYPNAVPIGLLQDARIIVDVEPGEILTFNDVELQDTLALKAWQATKDLVLSHSKLIR